MTEHEQQPTREADGRGSADPDTGGAAVSVALSGAWPNAKLPPEAAAFLKEQTALARLQRENLEADRGLLKRHLTLNHRHLVLRFSGDLLRIGLQLMVIALGLLFVGGVGAMVWSAHKDHGLVIEAFSVPSDLAQQGVTGQVVAAQVLDRISALQTASYSSRPPRTYANNWGDDLKVETPVTGVPLGGVNRFLRQWLGHETRVTGEIYRAPTGLVVKARTGNAPGVAFSGADADLDNLIQQAAESVYQRTQPYRYAAYFYSQGRDDESLAAATALSEGRPGEDRAYADVLMMQLLAFRGDTKGALARAADAVRVSPDNPFIAQQSARLHHYLGRDEDALRLYDRMAD